MPRCGGSGSRGVCLMGNGHGDGAHAELGAELGDLQRLGDLLAVPGSGLDRGPAPIGRSSAA